MNSHQRAALLIYALLSVAMVPFLLLLGCERKVWYSDEEVRKIIAKVDTEYRYAHDSGCGGNKACEIESYKWHLYHKKNTSYTDSEVKKIIRQIETEYRYAHDPGCGGDKACQLESYKWHLYYSGKPDFID